VTSRLGVIGLAWASFTIKGSMLLEQSRFSEILWGRLALGEFGRALVNDGAFQLSFFSFVYFPFAKSSLFFSRTLKLTQICE